MDHQQIVDAVLALGREVAKAQRQARADAAPRFEALRAECGLIGHVLGVDALGHGVRCCVVCGAAEPKEGA